MIIKRYCAHCHLGTYVTAPTRWVLLKVRYDSTKTPSFLQIRWKFAAKTAISPGAVCYPLLEYLVRRGADRRCKQPFGAAPARGG